MSAKRKLIVGLGNPGSGYTMTRHNVGFLVLDELASLLNAEFHTAKYVNGQMAKVRTENEEIVLLKPLTFMNSSGEAARRCMEELAISAADIFVIVDDVYLSFRSLRLRDQGSSGGHNGLKSIEAHLNTQSYCRLKIGVGNEALAEAELADFVLAPFTAEEKKVLPSLQKICAEVSVAWALGGTLAARQKLELLRFKE